MKKLLLFTTLLVVGCAVRPVVVTAPPAPDAQPAPEVAAVPPEPTVPLPEPNSRPFSGVVIAPPCPSTMHFVQISRFAPKDTKTLEGHVAFILFTERNKRRWVVCSETGFDEFAKYAAGKAPKPS